MLLGNEASMQLYLVGFSLVLFHILGLEFEFVFGPCPTLEDPLSVFCPAISLDSREWDPSPRMSFEWASLITFLHQCMVGAELYQSNACV